MGWPSAPSSPDIAPIAQTPNPSPEEARRQQLEAINKAAADAARAQNRGADWFNRRLTPSPGVGIANPTGLP